MPQTIFISNPNGKNKTCFDYEELDKHKLTDTDFLTLNLFY